MGDILILRCLGDRHTGKSYHLLVCNPKWQVANLAFPAQNRTCKKNKACCTIGAERLLKLAHSLNDLFFTCHSPLYMLRRG